MNDQCGVAVSERKSHEKARDKLRAMFAGNIGTACLERALYCKRNADNFLFSAVESLHLEHIEDFFRAGERTAQKGLLTCKGHLLRTELSHDRNHHTRKKP